MNETIKRISNDCVRYILLEKSVNDDVTSKELQDNVIKDKTIRFPVLLKEIQSILKGVYGLKLVKKATSNKYVLLNVLPYIPDISVENSDDVINAKNNIIFLILTHVFLSNGEASYDSIEKFLMKLDIENDIERLGIDLKQYVSHTLVKEYYLKLNKETDWYSWGPFAQDNFKMMDILKFAAEVLEIPSLTTFDQQYEMAENQTLNQSHAVESNDEDLN